MGKRIGIEISLAAAEAVKQCDVDVISAYPITPQTHIVERLSEIVAEGELNAEFVCVESEHSAMTVCVGASAAGARTFTCTSAQGLILMSEIVFITAGMRLPCVMILANRSLSAPLSIWADHSDVMSIRDCGWIQVFANNGQEVYDHVFHAYRVAEDRNVLLPYIINIDGFTLTHVVEPIEFLEQKIVDSYVPKFEPIYRLNPDKPLTMGAYAVPELFTEAKKAQDEALKNSTPYILKGWKEFGDLTGRFYNPVENYKTDGAEILLVTMGSIGETAEIVVDELRNAGQKAGLVKIRLFRPFPFEEFRNAVSGAKTLVVMDRAISFGGPGGPVSSEVRAALYNLEKKPFVVNYIVGLAGRDVNISDFREMLKQAEKNASTCRQEDYIIYGARE
jgi:pyruvate ferredoxin oxidoreductase alpha subunit